MKTIDLTTDEVAQLTAVIQNAPEKGYNIGEVRMAMRVLDKIETGTELVLEDAEWTFACKRIEETAFRIASPEIITFVDKLLKAE